MSKNDVVIDRIRKKKSIDAKIVFVSGNFNIVHPGHLRLLQFAKECGDFLVVGINSDKIANGAILNETHRLEGINSINYVDYATIIYEDPKKFILKNKPDIVVKGKEYEHCYNQEKEAVDSYGGSLLFSSGNITFSSIDLLQKEFSSSNINIALPNEYLKRHKVIFDNLCQLIDDFRKINVLIIGDLIIDEYVTCEPIGMSREDPTIVVSPIIDKKFLGGAGIVAAHACSLGANTKFISVCGKDEIANFAEKQLEKYRVDSLIIKDGTRPTTHKKRYRTNNGKTLLRVNQLRQHSISDEICDLIFKRVKSLVNGLDLLVFSDFNYGCLPTSLVNKLVDLCEENNVVITADSQSSTQIGNVSRFKKASLLTPTEYEARLALQDNYSGIIILAESLRKKADAKNIVITLAEEGVIVHAYGDKKWLTDQLPALNKGPKDVAGAGDSFFIVASLVIALGGRIWDAAFLGSVAAAIQVSRLGNIPLKKEQLVQGILNKKRVSIYCDKKHKENYS